MRNIFIAALLLAPGLAAAQGFDLNRVAAGEVKAVEIEAPAGEPERAGAEWTMMVFMNAKNNLDDSLLYGISGKWAQKDIKEMQKVGSTDKVNVLLEYGMSGQGSKRVMITKDGETLFSADPNGDMGDYRRVIDFVKWAKTNYPAKRYMLVLWNHGLGWIDPVMHSPMDGSVPTQKGILFDDETKNYVRTKQLGEILRQAGYVDVVVQNACLQQMAEVLYEMKDGAGLFIGSEETMLAYGFEYTKLLKFMNAEPAAPLTRIGEFFIEWEKDFFAHGAPIVGPVTMPLSAIAATMSAVNPRPLGDLPAYMDAFAKAAMKNNEHEAAKYAIENAVRFSSLDPKNDKTKQIAPYVDLYDFAKTFSMVSGFETAQAAERLMKFIKSKLVMNNVGLNKDGINGYDYTKVGGIAIGMTMKAKKLPPALGGLYETKYGDLSLSQASQWDEFVAWTDKVWRPE
ncbi:MAG: clostripain-related cysteine peptidase [Elusimicrobiales bacterium]